MAYIELKGVHHGYGSGESRNEVLHDINLEVERGEFVAILGYSGSGKTTLMSLLAGLLLPERGTVKVGGETVTGPCAERGLVFQNYSLLPWLSVYNNVGIAVNQLYKDQGKPERDRTIRRSLDQVNLSDALAKKPGELSGGMRQRNSVARTLSGNPSILLLDEPLSALDALTRSVIQDQILDIWKAENQTIILITNDVDEGLYMADRIIPLSVGPGSTFGPETIVDFPRPRDRAAVTTERKFIEKRNEVINYLLDEKKKEAQSSDAKAVSLPNIRPMDISMHKPSKFRGLRPRRRRKIA